MEILPVGADVFHEGGRTEGQKDRQTDGSTDGLAETNSRVSQFFEGT
jgi:hypothetical protein